MIRRAIACAAIASLALTVGACNAENAQAPVEHEAERPAQGRPTTEIGARQLGSMAKRGEAVLIDVRSPEEFAAGHIPGAINLPLETFDPAKVPQETGKQTVLYCRTGRRSEIAAGKLAAVGDSALHLTGGIIAWEKAGEPVSKGD